MRTRLHVSRLLIPALALGLMSGAAVSMAQPDMPPMDTLAPLKAALDDAGASALSSTQESSINALITEFRNAHQKPAQNTDIQHARMAYENAILNGDSATAETQAGIIGAAQAADMVQRETDTAAFAINVLAALKTGSGQIDALTGQLGKSGFVQLILSLAGGPGRAGGPGGPPRGGGPRFGRGGPPMP